MKQVPGSPSPLSARIIERLLARFPAQNQADSYLT